MTMDLLQAMVRHHVWLVGEMVDRAATLTDEQLDAPIEISVEGVDDDPTLRSLLSRLVGQMAMWNATIDGRPYDFDVERAESIDSMRARLAAEGNDLPRHRDGDRWRTAGRDVRRRAVRSPVVMTYGGMIAHVLTFAAHRRTLVAGALIDAGITDLGARSLYWVADAS